MTPLLLSLVLAQQPTVARVLPAAGDTTKGRPCVIAIDSLPRGRQVTAGRATNYYGGGGVRAHCNGTTTTFASDSIQYFAGLQRFDMIGNVHIRDTLLVLDANLASYFLRDEHLEAHKRNETVTLSHLRAEQVVAWATLGGAEALGMDSFIGSITRGKKADLVLIKNDQSPVMFPLLHPYGHVVYQAGRGDVHTVMVDGKVVKYDHRLLGIDLDRARQAVAKTVEYAKSKMGEQAWNEGMNPQKAEVELIENPYTYTDRERAKAGQQQE